MDLKEGDILGEKIVDHWYYISKGRAIAKLIGNKVYFDEVLDVGAGSGVFSRQLLDKNICQSATCVDPNYKKESKETHNGKSINFVKSSENKDYSLIMMMDVLEHVEDDLGLLKQYTENMPNEATIIITVPAFQFVWSGHDVFLEHYRRYTIASLEKLIENAGLETVRSRYFFATKFPIVAIIRWIKNLLFKKGKIEGKSELRIYPKWFNRFLVFVHDVERIFIFSFNRFFGLSIIAVCKKK